jgi:hypothetical protein
LMGSSGLVQPKIPKKEEEDEYLPQEE